MLGKFSKNVLKYVTQAAFPVFGSKLETRMGFLDHEVLK
jgi:hypothetical protein